jgi:hydrogenase expression/formation protein HypE
MTRVLLDHGNGGAATQELLSDLFLKHLSSPVLHCLEDSALLEEHCGRLAFSTDCYINQPAFFPGGNIGSLAVYGTINNLAMRGAMPLALGLGVIIEEGFPLLDLEKIIIAVSRASTTAEVAVVAGDTKVVPQGKINGICLNTSGIGLVGDGVEVSGASVEVEDTILVSGSIGDHGLAVREDSGWGCTSQMRPLHFMVQEILQNFPDALHALRDPTRGGLATSLVWLASASAVCLDIEEESVPISDRVRQLCDKLSLNPYHLSSEGRCILCCSSDYAVEILALMRSMEAGRDARIIGKVSASPMGRVRLYNKNGTVSFLEAV